MSSQKGHYEEDMCSSKVTGKVVVVAVKASKDISRNALVWALTHVVQPGDCIKLLVVIPALSSSIHLFSFQFYLQFLVLLQHLYLFFTASLSLYITFMTW